MEYWISLHERFTQNIDLIDYSCPKLTRVFFLIADFVAMNFSDKKDNSFPWYKKLLTFSIALIMIGALCRIQHWPYGKEMFITGFGMLLIGFFVRFLGKKEKDLGAYLEIISVILFVVHSVMSALKLPYNSIVRSAFFVCVIVYLVKYSLSKWKDRAEEKFTFSRFLFILGAFTIILGAIFKIQHWPGSTVLLSVGLCFGVFYIVLQLFSSDK